VFQMLIAVATKSSSFDTSTCFHCDEAYFASAQNQDRFTRHSGFFQEFLTNNRTASDDRCTVACHLVKLKQAAKAKELGV
jgi:hypothetical protein